jgi:K+-transporting ATPase KdpF subunit
MLPPATAELERRDMSLEFVLSGIAALLVMVYLVYALLRPERF